MWAFKSWGETFPLFSGCCPFVWVLLTAFVVLGPVWRCLPGSVSSLFRGRGDDPRTDLSQVSPLCYSSGMDLWLYVLVGTDTFLSSTIVLALPLPLFSRGIQFS